jgi:hypothetical protein
MQEIPDPPPKVGRFYGMVASILWLGLSALFPITMVVEREPIIACSPWRRQRAVKPISCA